MLVSLPDNDVQVKFKGGEVIVTMENGATKQLRVMDWISSLLYTTVKANAACVVSTATTYMHFRPTVRSYSATNYVRD